MEGVTYETYTYDGLGRLTDTNDSQGNHETFAYNSLNQLVSESSVIPAEAGIYPNGQKVLYEYDANGNLTKTTYPSGEVVTRTYDTLNRTMNISDSSGSVMTYSYDQINLNTQTLGNGRVTSYSYDNLNRLNSFIHTPMVGT